MENSDTRDAQPKIKKDRKMRFTGGKLLVGIILIGLLALSGFLYIELRDAKNNPEKVAEEQVSSLVAKVGKLISLPTDEQPTVATVQDKEKLKEQAFFAGAENGDKLLIYTKAQKAIIYRESTDSLVNVGPLTLDTAAPADTATPASAGSVPEAKPTN